MRKLSLLVTALAGCGRLAFDDVPTSGADAGEMMPVVCAEDGIACDDQNICTTSSACSGGTCVGTPPAGPCVVADSMDDFSTTQGDNGWYYGDWYLEIDPDGVYDPSADFEPFAIFTGELWRPPSFQDSGPDFTWAYTAVWGGHPSEFPRRYPIRRWISDVTGHASLSLHLAKSDPTQGDGTELIAYVDGVRVFSRTVEFDDQVGYTELVPIEVGVGTRVDVMLAYRGNEGSDTSDVHVKVLSR